MGLACMRAAASVCGSAASTASRRAGGWHATTTETSPRFTPFPHPRVPQDKVSLRTVEGRRLRRSVLKGAVVAFITAGASV